MGPGSKPSWHEHSNPPTTLVQVPLPHGFPMEHSSVSEEEPRHHQPTSTSNTLRKCCPVSIYDFISLIKTSGSRLTDALDPGVIQVVSKGAFTAERAIRVDADAVLAHSGVFQTLIHV